MYLGVGSRSGDGEASAWFECGRDSFAVTLDEKEKMFLDPLSQDILGRPEEW